MVDARLALAWIMLTAAATAGPLIVRKVREGAPGLTCGRACTLASKVANLTARVFFLGFAAILMVSVCMRVPPPAAVLPRTGDVIGHATLE